MIEDKDTNFVFLSRWLEESYCDVLCKLQDLLSSYGCKTIVSDDTNDIWARDYMPVQIEPNLFVKYQYFPGYLREQTDWITDCSPICEKLGIKVKKTDLIIDGGNVVACGDYIVMTDKVFHENDKRKGNRQLIAELEKVFEHEIIFIPWKKHEDDIYGHADGFIKYAGANKILMSNHRESYPKEAVEIRRRLEAKGFEVKELAFTVDEPNYSYNWAYINFLQVGNHIIMPSFGIPEDSSAEKQIQQSFPYCTIDTIDCRDLSVEGGALHCITWNAMLPTQQ